METFKIPSKVKLVITDHASNMLKAFDLLGYDEETCEEEADEEDIDSTSVDDMILNVIPVEHHGCFTLALQLVIKDGCRNAGQIA